MKTFTLKKRYLACILPSIWISGCNSQATSSVPASITISTNLGNNPLRAGESFVITAQLTTNGYVVESQLIESQSLAPGSESMVFSTTPCVVSSTGPKSCSITVTIESMAANSYVLVMQNSAVNPVALQGESISFKVASCNSCTIFWAQSFHKGNLLQAAIDLGYSGESLGVLGADYLCEIDPANPQDGNSYKAFITDGSNRYACTTPNCGVGGIAENKNWVLYPLTTYKLVTESVLFQTNESAIWPLGQPYQTRLYSLGYSYFSGFSAAKDWTSPAASLASNCNGWAGSGAPSGAILGNITGTDVTLSADARAARASQLLWVSNFNSASFNGGSQLFACKGIRKFPMGTTASTGYNVLCVQQ